MVSLPHVAWVCSAWQITGSRPKFPVSQIDGVLASVCSCKKSLPPDRGEQAQLPLPASQVFLYVHVVLSVFYDYLCHVLLNSGFSF